MARLHYNNDTLQFGTSYDYIGGGLSQIGPYRNWKRRSRPESISGDHKTPLNFDHASSVGFGTQTSYNYNRYWNARDGKYDTKLVSKSVVHQPPSNPSAHLGGLPLVPMVPGNPFGYPYVETPLAHPNYTNAVNLALSRLRDNKMELGTELAELKETSSYLYRKSIDLIKGLRVIKKGRIFRGLKIASGQTRGPKSTRVAKAWLESQYAIKPLIYLVDDAFKLATEGLTHELLVSASSKTPVKRHYERNYPLNSTISVNEWKAWSTDLLSIKFTGIIDDPDLFAASQLGLDNPKAIVWELVPFSFVVDWVLPVGTYLNALVGPKNVTFKGGYASVRTRLRGYNRYKLDNTGSGAGIRQRRDDRFTFGGQGYKRIAYNSFPSAKFPSYDNMVSNDNVITLAALLTVLTSK